MVLLLISKQEDMDFDKAYSRSSALLIPQQHKLNTSYMKVIHKMLLSASIQPASDKAFFSNAAR